MEYDSKLGKTKGGTIKSIKPKTISNNCFIHFPIGSMDVDFVPSKAFGSLVADDVGDLTASTSLQGWVPTGPVPVMERCQAVVGLPPPIHFKRSLGGCFFSFLRGDESIFFKNIPSQHIE